MTKSTPMNRTGTRIARGFLEEMLDTQDLVINDEPGPGPTDSEIRMTAIEEADPPGSPTDVATAPGMGALLDSLGGRLAYERGGTRLYEAILRKAEATAHLHGLKECVPDLEQIRDEEEDHAALLKRVIEEMDGDPTMETPCADIEGVMASGLLQVVHDPRTSLLDCLRCAAVAELADVENWTALVKKMDGQLGKESRAEMEEALDRELEHLATIRKWISLAEMPPQKLVKSPTKSKKKGA